VAFIRRALPRSKSKDMASRTARWLQALALAITSPRARTSWLTRPHLRRRDALTA
jgi:hypothetical protein